MNALESVLLAGAMLALILRRQLRAAPVDERRLYAVPAVLMVVGIAQGGLVGGAHPVLAVALFAGQAVAAIGFGVLRAATVRLWREPGGTLWRRGTARTAVAWAVSAAARAALIGAGYAGGIRPAPGGVLLLLGATLLVQNLVVGLRGRAITATATAGVMS
ncbi:hypothetical protein [Actinomadura roseirufa]|uniref:hypothetical protein n=1 Tax=Actinomadura roseirufa TaxID=2094049 RepID=UPI0010413DF8|nr:hypothetical protein [Actinomadura roseirufa]